MREDAGSVRLDNVWANSVAKKVVSAGQLLREVGEYEAAEDMLLGALGAKYSELPQDAEVMADGLDKLEQVLKKQLQVCDKVMEMREADGDVRAIEGMADVLAELCRVSEHKRLSFHYYNYMLPVHFPQPQHV